MLPTMAEASLKSLLLRDALIQEFFMGYLYEIFLLRTVNSHGGRH